MIEEKVTQIKTAITINDDVNAKNPRKHRVYEKDYILNPSTCTCENCNDLESITDESIITCDEIIDKTKTTPTKTVPTNFNEKEVTCKIENFLFYSLFY